MNPADELKAPIASSHAHDAGTDPVEAACQFQPGTGKEGVVPMGWPDQKEQWQAAAATEQGMHPIAAQEGTGMGSRGMTEGRLRIASAPRQDGGAINDQIASSYQTTAQCPVDREHEQGLKEGSSRRLPPFALLGGTGNTWLSRAPDRQSARQGQLRPLLEPIMQVLVGQTPQRAQEGDQKQGFLAVGARAAARSFRQRRRTAAMG